MLDQITPFLITYNEEPNISRALDKLYWAKDIIVVDSYSTDRTIEILKKYPAVRVFQRAFTSFEEQCNYGLLQTGIKSEWVLSLDADFILTEDFIQEIASLRVEGESGFYAKIRYCIFGKPLRTSLYPPVIVLFKKQAAAYHQDGHAFRVKINGKVGILKSYICHDDRKNMERWFQTQARYAFQEADKILSMRWSQLNWKDKIRACIVLSPVLIFFHSFFLKGLILDRELGLFYSLQRVLAEIMLSIYLLEKRFYRGG